VADVIAAALRLVAHLRPGERALVLCQQDIERLEQRIGGLQTISTPAQLHARVEALAGVKMHNVQLEFSPQHLEEIRARAERTGMTPEELIARILKNATAAFFTTPPAMAEPYVLRSSLDAVGTNGGKASTSVLR
jgi:hypothetical protein